MRKEWINYIEHLVSIGRKSTDDMTTYQACRLAGLLINDSPKFEITEVMDNDLMGCFTNWLINQEPEQEKEFLNAVKQKMIQLYKPMIDSLMNNQIASSK